MGVTIQAESHRVELAGLYEYEHDQQVLEFYDQPPAIKLIYQANNGRQVGVWHTPDYFVLRADRIGWEEWRTNAGLGRLSQTMPHRYCPRRTLSASPSPAPNWSFWQSPLLSVRHVSSRHQAKWHPHSCSR